MTMSHLQPTPSFPGPIPGHPGSQVAPGSSGERFRLTLAFAGLVVYLWVIHSSKAPIGSYAIGLGLFGLLLQPHRLRLPAPLLWFGAFILWAAVSSAVSPGAYFITDRVTEYIKLWLIFLVACNVAQTRTQFYGLVVAWLAIYALYPVRGTFFNFLIGHQYFGRYAWNFIFQNPNDLAALTLPIFAMSVAVLQGRSRRAWIRFSALAGVVVLPTLIFVTQSRGGILALATMGLLILVQYRRQVRGLAIGVLVAGAVFLVAPPEVWDRLGGLVKAGDTETLREVDAEGSAEQRFEIWRVAGQIITDHPISGVGLGRYPVVHAEYAAGSGFLPTARGQRDPHSIYLNILAETGIPGLLLFLSMVAVVLVRGRRTVHALATVDLAASRQVSTLLIGLIGFMQAGIFASLHRVAFLYVFLGVIASAIAVLAPLPASTPLRSASRQPQRPVTRGVRQAPLVTG